jgi:multiple sugar transport system ATP-binding protein
MIYVTHDQVEAMTMGDRICILNKGQIMQVDTPLNVYHYPANKFVAGFIGSPSMNFIQVKIVQHNNVLAMEFPDTTKMELPMSKVKQLEPYINQTVWFGVRPEHLNIVPRQDLSNSINGIIDLIEQMGNESYLHLSSYGSMLTARLNSLNADFNLHNKALVSIQFMLEHCHWFALDSEINLHSIGENYA